MLTYSISDLEKISGIKAHTIRIWEKRYNIIEPHRTNTNIRYYSDEQLRKLLNISILNRYGHRISEIAKLSPDELKDKVLDVAQGINNSDEYIDNLVVATIEMSENKFNKIIRSSFLKLGFKDTYINTIYPFYQKTKLLWQIGTLSRAHMYFICSLIKQKMIVAIDALDLPAQNTNRFVLYLPVGEFFEMNLLFYYYIIKKKGFSVSYIGYPISISELDSLIKENGYKYIIGSFLNTTSPEKLRSYLNEISSEFLNRQIFITGLEIDNLDMSPYKNIRKLNDYREFEVFLNDLS